MGGGYGGADERGVAVCYVPGAGGAYRGVEYHGWGGRGWVHGCADGACGGGGGEVWELDSVGGVQYLCTCVCGKFFRGVWLFFV